MKTIGLLGGMTWESSLEYYRIINKTIQQELGGAASAEIVLYSFNFQKIAEAQSKEDWGVLKQKLVNAAKNCKQSGAEFIVICTNTMHTLAEDIELSAEIPVFHIADTVGAAAQKLDVSKVGLLGTRFTMEEEFYKSKLKNTYNIETVIPEEMQRKTVNSIIFDELCKGIKNPDSKMKLIDVINGLQSKGAQAIVLGCTELPFLISQEDTGLPVINTTELHASAAAQFALKKQAEI
ncbi:MAG: aspartate/glutamate racemase family protein [Spirochaetia bacterium]